MQRYFSLTGIVAALLFIGAGCLSGGLPGTTPGTTGDRGDVVIDLHNSGLTAIPQDLLRRDDVRHLDLSDNAIETIPAEIRHMTSLELLDVSGNRLTGLPAELGQLEALRTLDVSDNMLTGLPYELGNLRSLEQFDLRGNAYSEADLAVIREGLSDTEIIVETALRCDDLPIGVKGCTKEYRPVCGQVRVECITTPCDPVPETFSNACVACQNERVDTYTDGACAGEGNVGDF